MKKRLLALSLSLMLSVAAVCPSYACAVPQNVGIELFTPGYYDYGTKVLSSDMYGAVPNINTTMLMKSFKTPEQFVVKKDDMATALIMIFTGGAVMLDSYVHYHTPAVLKEGDKPEWFISHTDGSYCTKHTDLGIIRVDVNTMKQLQQSDGVNIDMSLTPEEIEADINESIVAENSSIIKTLYSINGVNWALYVSYKHPINGEIEDTGYGGPIQFSAVSLDNPNEVTIINMVAQDDIKDLTKDGILSLYTNGLATMECVLATLN